MCIRRRWIVWAGALILVGCRPGTVSSPAAPATQPAPAQPPLDLRVAGENHFSELRQLTFEGENAEAYWSWDGTQLIFQTTRPPYQCDQIFRMPVDNGTPDLERVSSGKGRTTCSYFFPR